MTCRSAAVTSFSASGTWPIPGTSGRCSVRPMRSAPASLCRTAAPIRSVRGRYARRLARSSVSRSWAGTTLPSPQVALVAHGGAPLAEVPLEPPLTFLLGSEREGLPDDLVTHCHKATIPLPGEAESLNVAAAGAIALLRALAPLSYMTDRRAPSWDQPEHATIPVWRQRRSGCHRRSAAQ